MQSAANFSQQFQADLARRAGADPKRIVLPEIEDDRVLKAAEKIIESGTAQIILLGTNSQIAQRCAQTGVNLDGATIVDMDDPERMEQYVEKMVQLRKAKGMTEEKARQTLKDISYYATMMIVMGHADGMVSGAAHTTAHTIRPALQLIKTKPGIKMVSGSFIMVFDNHVDVYADCAVTLDPDPNGLADIAVSSAFTARQFGVDPKVALLSYSTLDSGSGPMVEKIKAGVDILRKAEVDFDFDGPLQFDAAVSKSVAAIKAPESKVAGHANVFIFPDLNAGNITYKAVQRTCGALAIGPILQGLNAPVNDLSRGANVEDIINTVVITAIQAQG